MMKNRKEIKLLPFFLLGTILIAFLNLQAILKIVKYVSLRSDRIIETKCVKFEEVKQKSGKRRYWIHYADGYKDLTTWLIPIEKNEKVYFYVDEKGERYHKKRLSLRIVIFLLWILVLYPLQSIMLFKSLSYYKPKWNEKVIFWELWFKKYLGIEW